jgi:PIN domain nuclease of toxin-antitoxin system
VTRLLLDTHLVLWWLNDDPRLPAAVVERLQAPGAEVFVSQASLWEMAIKVSIGRLRVDLPELEHQVPRQGFRWLAVSNAHLLAVAELESDGEHRDPFDRLLVCQSRVEPMLLLTVDSQLRRYGATVIVLESGGGAGDDAEGGVLCKGSQGHGDSISLAGQSCAERA